MNETLLRSGLTTLELPQRGKVLGSYAVDAGLLLIVATDRRPVRRAEITVHPPGSRGWTAPRR